VKTDPRPDEETHRDQGQAVENDGRPCRGWPGGRRSGKKASSPFALETAPVAVVAGGGASFDETGTPWPTNTSSPSVRIAKEGVGSGSCSAPIRTPRWTSTWVPIGFPPDPARRIEVGFERADESPRPEIGVVDQRLRRSLAGSLQESGTAAGPPRSTASSSFPGRPGRAAATGFSRAVASATGRSGPAAKVAGSPEEVHRAGV